MKKTMKSKTKPALSTIIILSLLFIFVLLAAAGCSNKKETRVSREKTENSMSEAENEVKLPEPELKGRTSVEEAIAKRRSVRSYAPEKVTLNQLSQLLWAAQGITDKRNGKRAAPSAGATYPLEIYVLAGNISGLDKGLYHYLPEKHAVEMVSEKDLRLPVAVAAGQLFISKAPMVFAITAVYERTTKRYGSRGTRYVQMEAGHVAENIYLEAESLGLGTVSVGAFDDAMVKKLLKVKGQEPLYIMPVGKPRN